ncbi:hypothetical protein RI129_006235 [Pyrocoelia pectoralis]|uniref:Zinc finger PHD-type domain-containing protein n=1 Tax=Pyrocoelia pectoralis TaxID=417401 RepID=A0AAN7VAD3_9COLE
MRTNEGASTSSEARTPTVMRTDEGASTSREARTPTVMRTDEGASTPSSFRFTISPSQIVPLPKIVGQRTQRKKVPTGTKVLTSSPYKNCLEEEKNRKDELELKRKQREEKKKAKPKEPPKKKINKTNIKKKLPAYVLSDSDEDTENDTLCMYCNSKYSDDKGGEGWIQCSMCNNWGHDQCAGVEEEDTEPFVCDLNCR